MSTTIPRILATTALCLAAVACNSHTEAATQLKGNTYYQRSSVSMGDLYRLPFVYDDSETIKKSYDAITFQAVYSAGTLTVTIKNTGEKDVILRSTGVRIRLRRTPFYVMQGKKEVALSLPSQLEISAGEELHLSCPTNNSMSNFVHVGFVSLIVVGERVYDGLPERKVPIQRG